MKFSCYLIIELCIDLTGCWPVAPLSGSPISSSSSVESCSIIYQLHYYMLGNLVNKKIDRINIVIDLNSIWSMTYIYIYVKLISFSTKITKRKNNKSMQRSTKELCMFLYKSSCSIKSSHRLFRYLRTYASTHTSKKYTSVIIDAVWMTWALVYKLTRLLPLNSCWYE
jgi:hypothetical protein